MVNFPQKLTSIWCALGVLVLLCVWFMATARTRHDHVVAQGMVKLKDVCYYQCRFFWPASSGMASSWSHGPVGATSCMRWHWGQRAFALYNNFWHMTALFLQPIFWVLDDLTFSLAVKGVLPFWKLREDIGSTHEMPHATTTVNAFARLQGGASRRILYGWMRIELCVYQSEYKQIPVFLWTGQ